MRVRKFVDKLTLTDLKQCPIWEFCWDEVGVGDQDETTVKPRLDLEKYNAMDGLAVVRASFKASNGVCFSGLIYINRDFDLGLIQPVAIVPEGQIQFWFGMAEPSQEWVDAAYHKLKVDRLSLFPLHFTTPFIENGVSEGTIPGFVRRKSLEGNEVITFS